MDLTTRIEIWTAAMLLILGVSHIARPRAWSALFVDLLSRSYGSLWIGMLTLPVGLTLIVTHNLWVSDLSVIVTLLGWGWTIKGTLYLLAPGMPARRFRHIVERPLHFVLAGAGLCVIGSLVLMGAFPLDA